MTCNPTPRSKFRVYFIRTYIYIRTITLYVRTITPAKCSTWNTLHIRETAELTARTAGWPALAHIADDKNHDNWWRGEKAPVPRCFYCRRKRSFIRRCRRGR